MSYACGTFQNLWEGFAALPTNEPKTLCTSLVSIAKFFAWYGRSSRRNRTMVSHTLCSFPSIDPPARHIHCWGPLEAVQYTFPPLLLSTYQEKRVQVCRYFIVCVIATHAQIPSRMGCSDSQNVMLTSLRILFLSLSKCPNEELNSFLSR